MALVDLPITMTVHTINVFLENVPKPTLKTDLPGPKQRIERTEQLIYCNTLLLQDSLSLSLSEQEPTLDKTELAWLAEIMEDPIERDRLQWQANFMVESFIQEDKDSTKIAEIVALGPILQQEPYRKLVSSFIKEFGDSRLLDVDVLQGLVQLVQSSSPGYLVSDDVIMILGLLRIRLQDPHQQSSEHPHHIHLAISRVLDVIADHKVQDVDRVLEHEPLFEILSGLKGSSDPYLMYQTCYAFQALQYVPDNETVLQAVLRRSRSVVDGVVKISALGKLDLGLVLEGLENLQEALGGMIGVAGTVYEGVSSLMESGRGVMESLKERFKAGEKRPWYAAIRAAYAFAQAGQLRDLNHLICEAPCRRDPLFQWGICQSLGEIAVDPLWSVASRQQAIVLLGRLYNEDPDWGVDESVKAWMLTIADRLISINDLDVAASARILKQELASENIPMIQLQCPLRSRLPTPAKSPILAKVQNISDLEYDLRNLRSLQLHDYEVRGVYLLPQAKPSLRAMDDELFPLLEKVLEFLASDRQVMLILGDSGSGKSSFNRHLVHLLWTEYKRGGPIPLFINLASIDDPQRDMVSKQLQYLRFSDEQICELRLRHQFILICDGYNEGQLVTNLHSTNELNRPGQWNAKMVISCRNQYLGQNYRYRFEPYSANSRVPSDHGLFEEAVIVPFSRTQIKAYVEQYVCLEPRTWTTQDYMDKLTSIPNLMEIVKNPFLLTLAMEALPNITEGMKDLSTIKIMRVHLYDTFIKHWLGVNKIRLQEIPLSKESRKALDLLVDIGFTSLGIAYATRLASAIFEHQGANPVVLYTDLRDRGSWKAEFFGSDPMARMLREASPLTRSGSSYRFVHRSMLEYFFSLGVFDPSNFGEKDEFSPQSDVGSTSPALFDAEGPLFRHSLLAEPSIIQFLCDRVQQSTSFKQQLFAIIKESKSNLAASRAAANAVTILFKSGVRLCSVDMRGVRIPGADLSGGELDSVQFQGADMTGVNLSRSWLRRADFSNAVMSGVQFGEWPFFSVNKEPTACAYSNDGDTLAVGLASGDINVYDTATWTGTRTLSGHFKAVTGLSYHPTSHQLFSASRDGTLRVWDLKSGISEQTFGGQGGVVSSIAVSPDGQQLATGGADKLVRLWFSDNLSPVRCLPGHIDAVKCLAYSPNGSVLASGSSDKTVRLWDTSSGNNTSTLKGHTDSISSIAYSPNGQYFVSGSNDTTVRIWDVSTEKSLAMLTNHTDRVSSVAYSPDGQYIVSASWDMTVRIWRSFSPFNQVSVLRGATKIITGLSVSPAGLAQVAACCNDKTIRLWDATPSVSDTFASETVTESNGHIGGVSAIAISHDGQQLATGGYDTTIRTCDPTTGYSLGSPLRAHKRSVAAVAFSPTAQVLASASWDHTIHLWDTERRELSKVIPGHLASVTSLTFLPSGHLISGSADWTIRLWNLGLDTQVPIRTFKGHTQGVRSVACSPDGSRIASASEDRTVRVWTLAAHSEESEVVFKGHSDVVACVTFSPVGRQIASASGDKSILLWNIEGGGLKQTVLLGHKAGVQCVAYSACGQYLASGSEDNSVIVWSVSSGSIMTVIGDVFGGISSIVWKQGGLELIVGCKDGSVRAWRMLVEEDRAQVQLEWGTGFGYLVATDACIDGVLKLGNVAFKLLKQRCAVGEMSREDNDNEIEE
ncbi:hypothetical protein KI688_003057 [Linnemannia hyalina]|uniref:WD40 repeat-like protein n=1 Tax=Linnemannia hyalina TaxID=64524 RepID=A0A9P7XRA4_9FUNG|nr:hypothetical protein KI688_003057 [Linnemannia hyalina]